MSSPASLELLLKRIDGEDELHERRLPIDYNTEIMIGRASKTEQKQLVPAVDNGWIRNPVISRHHAILTLEPSEAVGTHPLTLSQPDTDRVAMQKSGVVFIQDKKSSHGTYVNGENIQHTKHALQDGDKIRFGSEVMRGEETFRPPVFSFETSQIGLTYSVPSPETTVIEEISTIGKTISVPDESDVESDAEEDISGEEQASSQAPMSSVNMGSFLGSQANPWAIDEADMIPDSAFLKATEEAQDDEVSSESNISLLYDDDLEIEEPLDTDEDEEVENVYDEEESEIEDHDSEDIAESPIYTPKSPRYIPEEAESYNRIDRDYTPAQYGNQSGYLDGPFAYSRPSWASTNNHAFVGAPQPWETEVVKQPARPTSFSMVSPPTEKLVPQYSLIGSPPNPAPGLETISRTPVMDPISRTTSTRDLIDENRRAHNKADMSIRNLINPSPGRESNIAGTKRRAEVLDLDSDEEETLLAMVPKQTVALPAELPFTPVDIASDKLPQTPESLSKEPIDTPVLDTVAPLNISTPVAVTTEPPRKKQKLRAMVSKAAIFGAGVMVGSAGMLGGLMSLPDGFFQS
ncbi:hypothetical protein EG328_006933 [Venturia inaequalis]|uniref:FHA domain-containing protein n=1 Tax=Venturia inaequalis TaxID=5025 RepID=A0A8H3UGW8_VENIN|nr:hypothetical protein EG328_006933 [Venturia inaequalis]RDI79260.1 hypothetical protein Vi05172_g10722 [Venturia inaequalis]